MKKLIAIMMVLALVAGFAFADPATTYTSNQDPATSSTIASGASETHKIIVRSDVGEVIPVFNLTFSGVSTNGDATAETAPFGQATNNIRTAGTATKDTVYVGFSLNENGSAEFTATVTAGKIHRVFDIEFSDGVFAVRRNGNSENETHSPEKIVTAPGEGGNAVSAALGDAAATGGADNKKITVTFNGRTVSAASTVAKATYYYLGDDTIDATDVNHVTTTTDDDWYYATIQMKITAR